MQSLEAQVPTEVPAAAAMATPATSATILGRYRVMAACGTGGFGQVLTCWDTRLQRRVAIKRIPVAVPAAGAGTAGTQAGVTLASPFAAASSSAATAPAAPAPTVAATAAAAPPPAAASTMAAALAEARTASLLAHPNIVTVYDFEADGTYAYLVMEYVDGITLAELLARVEGGTLTPDEACFVARSVADALAFAHDNGVLHLDIKPSNIMVNAAGVVKLCDFGMATLASAAGYGGARGGTVGYMPPEQVAGDMVDERSDVFSLAVVLWQALTGENPFAAATAEASAGLMARGPRVALSQVVPDAAGSGDAAMGAALAPDPASRTASVREFVGALTFALGDAEVGAASVASLVAQAVDDEVAADPASDLPVAFRYPWLPGAITRAAAALLAALTTAPALASLLTGAATAPWAVPTALLATAACTAAWPPAGSALAALSLVAAMANPPQGAAAIMLPGVLALLFVIWWAAVAQRNPHATAAFLAPAMLRAPAAGAAIAGAYLPPARAAATAATGWAMAHVFAAATAVGFNAPATASTLAAVAANPASWASAAGAAVSGAVVAALARTTGSASRAVAAQIVGATVLIATQMASAAMENAGVAPAPTWPTAGVAVTLCVAMCIVAIVRDDATNGEG